MGTTSHSLKKKEKFMIQKISRPKIHKNVNNGSRFAFHWLLKGAGSTMNNVRSENFQAFRELLKQSTLPPGVLMPPPPGGTNFPPCSKLRVI